MSSVMRPPEVEDADTLAENLDLFPGVRMWTGEGAGVPPGRWRRRKARACGHLSINNPTKGCM